MKNKDLVIIDYQLGNLFNVQKAFKYLGYDSIVSNKTADIKNAKKIVLPGVGAFKAGMKSLINNSLVEPIINEANNGKPILGVCLGMQLLMSTSEENGIHDGLNLVNGSVKKFTLPSDSDKFRIPHYGWTPIFNPNKDSNQFDSNSILSSITNGTHFYFVHSYYVSVKNTKNILATSSYGKNKFTSVIKKDNISACQFHPERSGVEGLKILEKFIKDKN